MRKPTLKRLALGLVQQTAALLLMVAIAAILFNSYLQWIRQTEPKYMNYHHWMRRLNLRTL